MARKRKRKGKRVGKSFPLLQLAFPIDYGIRVWNRRDQGIKDMPKVMLYEAVGYDMGDGTFHWDRAAMNATLIIAPAVAHKVLNATGVNRKIGKLTKTFLGMRITL